MGDDSIIKIYAAYGVTPVRLLPVQKGYRNESHPAVLTDGSKVNLIIYKSEPEILPRVKAANAVADYLSEKGLPTRRTIDKRVLKLSNTRDNRYASLYTYLDGETIPWEGYTREHIKELGRAMSDMHYELKQMPGDALPGIASEYRAIFSRMRHYFDDPSVVRAMRDKLGLAQEARQLEYAQKLLSAFEQAASQQPLHMDFVRSNILFNGNAITGIIDFEKTGRGHPLLDIARTLAFLLVDCKHKEPSKVYKYFLKSGYGKRGKSKLPANDKLLEGLTSAFLFHDFYKFLRHNPYEHLHENEHFVRTKNMLIQRKLLSGILDL
jgi:Ser/Thr protein kinase RdoA (MazF antagonist)